MFRMGGRSDDGIMSLRPGYENGGSPLTTPDLFLQAQKVQQKPFLTLEEIKAYVEKDEPLMSSGSYKYESYGKELFESINGDPFVIQGLPLEAIKNFFR